MNEYKPCQKAPHPMTGEWNHNPPEIGPPDFHIWNPDGETHYICNGKIDKNTFIEKHGHRYSRCSSNPDTHEGHAWSTSEYRGENVYEACWWCSGEEAVPVPPHEDCAACETGMTDSHPDHALPKSTEVQRWADPAMYAAEPVPEGGPRVYLLWMTPDPLGAIAAACKMYKGEVVRDLSAVTDEERLEYLEQVQRTKLKAPFEFVKFHFLIEGVTRAFTHQLVRQRTAVYAQESLRFAVKEDMPVGRPPSIPAEDPSSDEVAAVTAVWDAAVGYAEEAYKELVSLGVPAEDARGLLPHNTLTRVHYSTDLRALLDHAGNRLCTQAQFEWRMVFSRIVEAVRGRATDRNNADGMETVYFSDMLADLFKPVCYQTGRCEFKANFDRACSIRGRVDANEAAGRTSAEWGREYDVVPADEIVAGVGPKSVIRDSNDRPVFIGAIKPGEWLLDPNAARKG